MRTQRIRRVASAMQTVLLTILATFVAGCATFTPPVRKPETIVDEKTLEARLKTYREIEERQQRRSASHVRIEGTDIREPPSLSPVTSRMYSFDLWFNADAVGDDAYKALLDHRVTIDVAGVPATFERVNYGTNGSTIHSSNMIRVKVPYAKGISSFNIIAYINDAMEDFESERMSRAEKARDCKEDNCENLRELLYAPNPYLEVKRVRVFNGDLTTRIYMLSKREVENAFGKAFAEAFYVGKAYFRNEQTEGKLIVHTTSLRARTLFRRRAITGPAIDISKLEKDIPAYDPLDTSRLRRDEARCVLRLVKEATGEQRPTVDDCLRRKADDPSIDKVKIELRDLANRLMRAKPHAADAAREKLIASARELVDEVRRSMIASAVTKAQKDKKPTKVVAALKNAQPPANFLEDSAAGLQRGFSALRPEEILALTSAKTSTNDLPPRLDSEMRGLMQRAATWLNAKGNAAGTAKRSDVATDQAVEETLSRAIRTVASTVDDSLEAVFRPIIAETTSASPLSIDLRRRVGLTGKLAASSQDVVNQWKLTKYGYVWEDYYRPMTFESVLLSITAETHDQRSQKVLRVMESLGVLAAGFVGLGNISRGFARPDYAERVAFTTGVLLPEARRIFGKDIAKYLNNLATTALPSVLTLEPHQSRDGYVFFPRGPIFGYGVDEFSTEEPTYIVNIDSDDVAVEGEIVSASTAFQSGYKDVATQVSDGKQLVEQQLVDFAEIEEKLNRNRVGFALNDACRMLAEGDKSGASARLDAYINADGNPKAVAPIRERIAADLDCSGNALTPPATDTP